jgi:hypothetical protein
MQRRLADLPIPRKLTLIIAIPFCVVLVLLALSVAGFEALSTIRAYVGGEGVYSIAQKDAINHLDRYARSGDPREYQLFESDISVSLGDQVARTELEKPDYDYAVATRRHPDRHLPVPLGPPYRLHGSGDRAVGARRREDQCLACGRGRAAPRDDDGRAQPGAHRRTARPGDRDQR